MREGSYSRSGFRAEVDRMKRERWERVEHVLAALDESPALIGTDGRGNVEMMIVSGEMQTPEEGAFRVTYFLPDGPRGHDVRDSIADIADLIASNRYVSVEPATEDEVEAWTSTPEFAEGSKRVAFIQAINELGFRASAFYRSDPEVHADLRQVMADANDAAAAGDFDSATRMLQQTIADLGS